MKELLKALKSTKEQLGESSPLQMSWTLLKDTIVEVMRWYIPYVRKASGKVKSKWKQLDNKDIC